METHKTVFDPDFKMQDSYKVFKYQEKLTPKPNQHLSESDQNTINEIVLWKMNRYVKMDDNLLKEINIEKTKLFFLAYWIKKDFQIKASNGLNHFTVQEQEHLPYPFESSDWTRQKI